MPNVLSNIEFRIGAVAVAPIKIPSQIKQKLWMSGAMMILSWCFVGVTVRALVSAQSHQLRTEPFMDLP